MNKKETIELLKEVYKLFVLQQGIVEGLYRTPAQTLREEANLLERKDKIAKEFKSFIESLIVENKVL